MSTETSKIQQKVVKVQSSPSQFSYQDKIVSNELSLAKCKPKPAISWTDEENLKYAVFIDKHTSIFSSKQKRKATRIYTYLSKFLEGRTAQQCRSHFQKIIMKHRTIYGFMNSVKQAHGKNAYSQMMEQCPIAHEALKALNQNFHIPQLDQKPKKTTVEIQTQKVFVFSREQFEQMMYNIQMQVKYFTCAWSQKQMGYPQCFYYSN